MKLDAHLLIYLVALVAVSVLVGFGKMPQASLIALLAWLVPSPIAPSKGP